MTILINDTIKYICVFVDCLCVNECRCVQWKCVCMNVCGEIHMVNHKYSNNSMCAINVYVLLDALNWLKIPAMMAYFYKLCVDDLW